MIESVQCRRLFVPNISRKSGSSHKRKSCGTLDVQFGSNTRRREKCGRDPAGGGGPSDGDDRESGIDRDRDDDDDDDDKKKEAEADDEERS